MKFFFNPSLTGAVLQTHCNLLIYSFTNSKSKSKSLKHHYSKTVKARELKFRENVYPPTNVTCRVSCVTCHESCVMCHLNFLSGQSGMSQLIKGLLSTRPRTSQAKNNIEASLFFTHFRLGYLYCEYKIIFFVYI